MAAAAASKVFLTVHGVERDDVAGNVEFLQKLLRRRDFVGFFVDLDMRQNQGRIGGEGAEYLLGPAVAKGVEAAAKGLAVQSQHPPAAASTVQVRSVLAKGFFHTAGIEFAQDRADRGVRWWPLPTDSERSVQPCPVNLDECADAAVRVGSRNHCQNRKQQHIPLLVALAFGPATDREWRRETPEIGRTPSSEQPPPIVTAPHRFRFTAPWESVVPSAASIPC